MLTWEPMPKLNSCIILWLGLNNNLYADTYNNAAGLCANDIIDKNARDLKIEFVIDNIPIENNRYVLDA